MLLATILIPALTACSGTTHHRLDLAAGDQHVCAAAATGDARTVYETRTQATRTDIKKQLTTIYPGSADRTDHQAISTINDICRQHGYTPPASPTSS